MCGEDDMKRAVYNMKESFEERGSEHQKETKGTQKKTLETKVLNLFKRKTNRYISANPSINVRLNHFSFEVNLVLGRPRSTNFIVWAFNVRTQYQFWIVTN